MRGDEEEVAAGWERERERPGSQPDCSRRERSKIKNILNSNPNPNPNSLSL